MFSVVVGEPSHISLRFKHSHTSLQSLLPTADQSPSFGDWTSLASCRDVNLWQKMCQELCRVVLVVSPPATADRTLIEMLAAER